MAGLFGLAISTLYMHTMGVMIGPLEQEFGWTRAQISLGPSIVTTIGCIAAPFMGLAIDRFGSRRIALPGMILLSGALAMLSLATSAVWTWWALWFVVALVQPSVKPTVWIAAISSLFSSGRGFALAVTLCGTGLGTSVTPILANMLIESYGWRTAYVVLAAGWGLITIPMVYFFFFGAADKHRLGRNKEADAKQAVLTGVSGREGLLSFKFFKLAVASVLLAIACAAVAINFVPVLTSAGLSRSTAAGIAGLTGIASISGRLLGGYLIDRFSAGIVVGASATLPALGGLLLVLLPGSVPAAMVAVVLIGLSVGVEFDGVAYLASRHFGLRHFGLLFGTIGGLIAFASGLGPLIANYSYDLTHSYVPMLWTVIPTALVSAVIFLLLGPYPHFAAAEEK